MKHLLLLMSAVLCITAPTAFAQTATFTIDWNYPDTLHAPKGQITVKRTGTMRNLNAVAKQILFRYNIDKLLPDFSVGFCFGDLCYFQFPGDDNPYEREPQNLPASGTLPVYSLCNKLGSTVGTSTVWYEMFDKNDTTDKLPFYITYVYENPTSVTNAAQAGIGVWPNPATSVLTVGGADKVVGANLYSASGVLLKTYGVEQASSISFNIHELTSGAYHMVFNLSDGSVVQAPFAVVK